MIEDALIPESVYKRIVLKLSGESLKGNSSYGIDPAALTYLADELAQVSALGVQIAVVVGGGNFWRGEEW